MSKEETTTDTSKEEELKDDVDTTEETEEETEVETEEESEETEEEDSTKNTEKEIDFDAELEKERKGKPDPEKAKEAFKKREVKREEGDEEDKPLTRKDLESLRAEVRQELVKERVSEIAKKLATSEKEAELIIEKWSNRTFPAHLSLEEQIEEAYVITHRKKLLGERNEALRALKNKDGVNKNPATSHKEPTKAGEPQLSSADRQALTAVGYVWNGSTRRYEKKLANGNILVRDPKTKQTIVINKR